MAGAKFAGNSDDVAPPPLGMRARAEREEVGGEGARHVTQTSPTKQHLWNFRGEKLLQK